MNIFIRSVWRKALLFLVVSGLVACMGGGGSDGNSNTRPVANAGPDQTVFVGDSVTLNGSSSTDVDGDTLSYQWSFQSRPFGSAVALTAADTLSSQFSVDVPGTYVIELIVNDGETDSAPDTVQISTQNSPPVADAGPDQTVLVGDIVQFDGLGSSDVDDDPLSYQWTLTARPDESNAALDNRFIETPSFLADQPGVYEAELIVNDGAVDSAPDQAVISTQNSRPVADAGEDIEAHVGDTVTLDGSDSSDADGDSLFYFWSLIHRPEGSAATLTDFLTETPAFVPDVEGDYVAQLIVNDGQLDSDPDTAQVSVTVFLPDDEEPPDPEPEPEPGPDDLPPDPAAVAPSLSGTEATILAHATEFLYAGPDPVQVGVAPGTIENKRATVVRGQVITRAGAPLAGVRVTIKDRQEFGHTLSRADGMFDLAVNGGGLLTIEYARDGYLPAQRKIQAPWQDFVTAPTVALISLDPNVTQIDLAALTAIAVARGSTEEDEDGERQATVLVRPGTVAEMILPNGDSVPLSTINVRATEYTVGPNGPEAMPGELPPMSGYTYAVELSVDEALAAGATRVQFDRPVAFYLENFLDFPVGGIVPVGWYDRDKAAWIPSDNGRVIAIVSIEDGLAGIDIDGDGEADGIEALAGLGIDTEERERLAILYTPGVSLWRVEIDHFTPWDCNWPFGPGPGARPPEQSTPRNTNALPSPTVSCGSIIECETQVLGERVGIAGTPHNLNYRSDRMPGRLSARTVNIPLSGENLPPNLKRIDLMIQVAGQVHKFEFPAAPSQSTVFTWDGLDVYGRSMRGGFQLTGRIDYVYDAVYLAPSEFGRAFATASAAGSDVTIGRNRSAGIVQLSQNFSVPVSAWNGSPQGLGGWTLEHHHTYDPAGRILYLGSGEQRSVDDALGPIITTVAGNGSTSLPGGDGGPATEASLGSPSDVEVGPDGSLYIAAGNLIRRVDPEGMITTVAGIPGIGGGGYSGDGGPATEAEINSPNGIALGPDGSLYIADGGVNRVVRRVGPDGIITTVVGNGFGDAFGGGDGSLATEIPFDIPGDVITGPDGALYIVVDAQHKIRRVNPDGIIMTVAGTGSVVGTAGDGGPATAARVNSPWGIALGSDGSVYTTHANRVRRVGPDGVITTVAGTGTPGFSGDGGSATLAELRQPHGIALGPDGSLYIADTGNHRIRRVGPDGIITTVVGSGALGNSGDGGPATEALLRNPWGITLGPDGSLYIADQTNRRIRRVSSSLPGFNGQDIAIPSADGSELYRFNASGRHLETLDALTGSVVYRFGYDPDGRLVDITDIDGNVTTVERDDAGNVTAIEAPFGQRTELTVDANGYLATVANPAGEVVQMGYDANGLLTEFTDPRSNASTFTYDTLGRLLTDTNAGGGSQALARVETGNGYEVTRTTALGRSTTHRVEYPDIGGMTRVDTFPDGTTYTRVVETNGKTTTTLADGTVIALQEGGDPRFQMMSPIPVSRVTTTGGLTSTITRQRSVNLADESDPLSLTTLTESVSVNGRTSTRVYNAATRTATTTTAAGRQSVSILDEAGRVTSTAVSGLLAAGIGYDPQGRLAVTSQGTGADERTTGFAYDSLGNLASVTDPLGRSATFAYDTADRVTTETRLDGAQLHYGYDAGGNLTSIQPPGRPAHVFHYDTVNQTTEYVPPDVGAGTNSTVYTYDLDRVLTRVVRPDGLAVDFSYDVAGRLVSLTVPEGAFSYIYDPITGKLTGITTPDGDDGLGFTYNGALLTQSAWTGGVEGSVGFTYDNDFRVSAVTVNDADPVTLTYDADSLLTGVGALSLTRSPQNGLLTGSALGTVTDILAYNGFGEVTQYEAQIGGATEMTWHYVYDKLGRIIGKTETTGGIVNAYEYGYDLAGRLIEVRLNGATTAAYTYDANGNRLSRTAGGQTVNGSYDDQDRLLSYGSATYTYTPNGELLTKVQGGQTTGYQYDVLGNLRSVSLPDGREIEYIIDGQNRRIGKKIDGVQVQGFLYQDQLKPIAELDGDNNIVSHFIYATGINVPDYMVKDGVTYRIITDHLGSPRIVIDTATGSIAQRMDYDKFGNVTLDTNPGFQPFGFAGGLYDWDTGLVRFGARDYDAVTGRWTAKDPIGFGGGDTNLYLYASNDPVNLLDFSGLKHQKGEEIFNFISSAASISRGVMERPINRVLGLGRIAFTKFDMLNMGMSYKAMRDDPTIGNIANFSVAAAGTVVNLVPKVRLIRYVGGALLSYEGAHVIHQASGWIGLTPNNNRGQTMSSHIRSPRGEWEDDNSYLSPQQCVSFEQLERLGSSLPAYRGL